MFSIEAMFENNVFRAQALLERFCEPLCRTPPRHFFCVSTDKASNPANLMGASKKLMERLLMAYAPRLPVATARFANVAFSNGSLLDGFLHRLALNQPLSAPNDVRRYFVTPQESGQICLLAGVLGGGQGGPGRIVFPKLDLTADTRTFSEIAEAWLANQGLTARRCATEAEAREQAARRQPGAQLVPGLLLRSETSGEKPVEEFHGDDEVVDLTRFASLGVVTGAPVDRAALDRVFDDLKGVFAQRDRYADPAAHKAALVARLGEASTASRISRPAGTWTRRCDVSGPETRVRRGRRGHPAAAAVAAADPARHRAAAPARASIFYWQERDRATSRPASGSASSRRC